MNTIQSAIRMAIATFDMLVLLNPDLVGVPGINIAKLQLVDAGLECGAIDKTTTDEDLLEWARNECARAASDDIGPIDLDSDVWDINSLTLD